jgi:hypothetical protein
MNAPITDADIKPCTGNEITGGQQFHIVLGGMFSTLSDSYYALVAVLDGPVPKHPSEALCTQPVYQSSCSGLIDYLKEVTGTLSTVQKFHAGHLCDAGMVAEQDLAEYVELLDKLEKLLERYEKIAGLYYDGLAGHFIEGECDIHNEAGVDPERRECSGRDHITLEAYQELVTEVLASYKELRELLVRIDLVLQQSKVDSLMPIIAPEQ